MNEAMGVFLLFLVPGLPLLLAFPALRSYLPRPCYFALLPAIILAAVPMTFSIDIPWLLLGSRFGINDMSRLLLAMSVLLWLVSAGLFYRSADYSSEGCISTCFMLALAGSLGVILAMDLISFFVFLTLTGYGFYALLVSEGGEGTRQSGRIYLSFMIIADLVLFEALLIAAAVTDNLAFEAVHHAIAQSSSLDLYLLMVIIAFMIKAGLWPLSFWLLPVFRSSRPVVAVLLGGVPVAAGLLGMVRWLPLGEISSPEPGMIIQYLGGAAVIYAVLAGLIRAQLKISAIYVAIMFTGFFFIAVGTGLTYPAVWQQYGYFIYFFIALFSIGFAVLVMLLRSLESKYPDKMIPVKQSDSISLWFKQHWPVIIERLTAQMRFDAISRLKTKMNFLWQKHLWERILDRSESFLQRWNIAITLFLVLGLIMVFVRVLPF